MNTFALELFDDEGSCCTFYTVRWEEAELSETDKFLQKFSTNSKFKSYLQELTIFVFKKIAHEVGALEEFFRFENTANALPPSGEFQVGEVFIQFKGFPLRLYCFRLSNKLVVLFNGGEKNSRTAQEGDTSMVFHEANQFAERILKSIRNETIYITEDGRGFRYYDNSTEIFI